MSDPLRDILIERARQDDKFGEQNHHPLIWLAVLGEEKGEADQALLDCMFNWGPATMLDFKKEVIETAAVALAILECGERNEWCDKRPTVPSAEFELDELVSE